MKKKVLFFSLFLVFLCQSLLAQKEHNIWYFGHNAGLDFNSGAPVSINGGKILQHEGCASICNSSGAILFYTDGMSVWDAGHNVMPNGTGLLGGVSCSQSAMILKKPGSATLYYLFTTTEQNSIKPVSYSIIDMTLSGGMGDVTVKNFKLLTLGSEKMTYVRHSNNTDYWVICHDYGTNNFYTYLLSANGLNATPVISAAGSVPAAAYGDEIGYMKSSPCGNKLAVTSNTSDFLELFDFDNSTGAVSNAYTLANFGSTANAYGVEFSPQGNFLYCSLFSTAAICQFNLNAGSNAAIAASRQYIGLQNVTRYLGSLQTGPDGKIYTSGDGTSNSYYIGCINNPESAGFACNFNDAAIYIFPNRSDAGLNNFILECSVSTTMPMAHFSSSDSSFCNEDGKCIDFTDQSANNPSNWKWYFPGATPDTSTQQNPTNICYYVPGIYPVSLVVSNSSGKDSLTVSSLIIFKTSAAQPIMTRSNDTLFCSHAATYQWYFNGSLIPLATDSFFVITGDGTYAVNITDEDGCSRLSDGFPVSVKAIDRMGSWKVYPNPAGDKLWVMSYGLWVGRTAFLRITNVLGEMVLQSEITNQKSEIDVHVLAKGMYLIEIGSSEKVYRGKFIKE